MKKTFASISILLSWVAILILSLPCYGFMPIKSGIIAGQAPDAGGCNGNTIDSQTTGGGTSAAFYYAGYFWKALSFTASGTTAICTIEVGWHSVGSPTGDVSAFLYSDDGSGSPSSQLATCSNTIDASTIGGVEEYSSWTLTTPYATTASTRYHIVLYKASASSTNYLSLDAVRTAGTENLNRSNDGSAWTNEDDTANGDFYTKD